MILMLNGLSEVRRGANAPDARPQAIDLWESQVSLLARLVSSAKWPRLRSGEPQSICVSGRACFKGQMSKASLNPNKNLSEAVFSSVAAQGLNFSSRQMLRTVWHGDPPSNAHRADFTDTTLAGSFLSGIFTKANFTRAVFTKIHPEDTTKPWNERRIMLSALDGDFSGAKFDHAILPGSRLSGDYQNASFINAQMMGASLKGNFTGANFAGADLRRADLRRADLRRADLRGATLDEANLRGAWYSPGTKFPSGFDPIKARMKLYMAAYT